jgi:hypothetical protein
MKIKKCILVGLTIIVYSILIIIYIYRDSFKNSDLINKELFNFSNVVTNSCNNIGNNTFEITGLDPYILIQNINYNINNVKIQCTNQNISALAIYFDDGSGFNEKNSLYKVIARNSVDFKFNKKINMKNIRIDFESAQLGGKITINSIKLNNVKPINIINVIIISLINIIFLSTNYYFFRKLKLVVRIFSMIIIGILVYCLDSMLLNSVPVYLKFVFLILGGLFNNIMFIMATEVNYVEVAD